MARIVIELTNRCNLACRHCFSGRHGGNDDLPDAALDAILVEAKAHGFDHLTFTGGDPTVAKGWERAMARATAAGYAISFVTNGQNFARTYPKVLPYLPQLRQITFSLDGGSEASHDQLRGRGSFRKVLQAMSICRARGIPFSNNMVVMRHNRTELRALVELAANLGSRGVRFGHLMHAPLTTAMGLDLTPEERREVDAEIRALAADAPIPVALAPGFETQELFPCAPLHLEEVNVDVHGRLTKCCHLSSHGDGVPEEDVIGSLLEASFGTLLARLKAQHEAFREAKLERAAAERMTATDYAPCWYCSNHYRKSEWLRELPDHPWTPHLWSNQGSNQGSNQMSSHEPAKTGRGRQMSEGA